MVVPLFIYLCYTLILIYWCFLFLFSGQSSYHFYCSSMVTISLVISNLSFGISLYRSSELKKLQ
jgi:hypothetical protein